MYKNINLSFSEIAILAVICIPTLILFVLLIQIISWIMDGEIGYVWDQICDSFDNFFDRHPCLTWLRIVVSICLLPILIFLWFIFVMPPMFVNDMIDRIDRINDSRKPTLKAIINVLQTIIAIVLIIVVIVNNVDLPSSNKSSVTIHPETTAVIIEDVDNVSVQQAEDDEASIYVYITDSGEKYHRLGCQYLRNSCHEITLSKAKRRGYTPCSKCRPQR